MFKKRATPLSNKTDLNAINGDNNDDDHSASSPTITVSVPSDVFDQRSTTSSVTTTTTTTTTVTATTTAATPGRTSKSEERQWNQTTSSSRRSSYERNNPFLPQNHQPGVKTWNPNQLQQRQGNGNMESRSLGGMASAGSSPSLSTHSGSSSPSSLKNGNDNSSSKSPAGMLLNLTGVFSSTQNTVRSNSSNNSTANGATVVTTNGNAAGNSSAQPQSAVGTTAIEAQLWNADWIEPASPAFPRYIPAIAGKGASSVSPNFSRLNSSGSGGRLNSTVGSIDRTIVANSSSLDRRTSENTVSPSYKSRTAGTGVARTGNYIPNDNTNGQFMQPQRETYPDFRRNQQMNSQDGEDRTKSAAGESLEMSWIHSSNGLYDDNDHDDDYDYNKDHKKDRSFYTRRDQRKPRFPLLFSDPKRMLRARLFCLRQNRRLHPCIRIFILLFLAGSVCFTTIHLVFLGTGSSDGLTKAGGLRKSFDYTEQQLKVRKMLSRTAPKRVLSAFDVEAQNYSIHQWSVDTFDIRNSKAIAKVGEDYMLSKAFSGAMHPTRVIPFYFKASFRDEDDDDDHHADDNSSDPESDSSSDPTAENQGPVQLDPSLVTITTLITPNRYGVFLKLVKQYRGPISVAMHIRKGPEQDALFHELHAFFRDNAILRKYVDLHVIVDGIDFQLNMWRNVARMFARTDYFMMLDVDFHIPSSLKRNLHYDPRIQQLLASGAALVIPAFEYKVDQDPKDSKYFPDTKAELLPLLEKGHIHVFHDSFPPGHGATDTPRWIKMSQGNSRHAKDHIPPKGRAGFEEDYSNLGSEHQAAVEDDKADELRVKEEYLEHEADGERPYKVTKFEPKYEPYIILKKEGTPWCDERFVGYGANKAACLFEIYISGIDFWVMPHDFLIHQYHDYPTTDRKNGRILNKQLFVSFQQEVCFRTLYKMINTGEWYTSKADNLRHQCQDFEGFLQSADELAKEFEIRHPDSLLKDPVFVTEEEEREASRPRWRVGPSPNYSGGHSNNNANQQKPTEEEEAEIRRNRHSHERGTEITFGKQLADGEQDESPWMSKPQGKIWGGVQPKTYYVPPPPEGDEPAIPLDGIGLEAALNGTPLEQHDKSPFSFEEAAKADLKGPGGLDADDLIGERLERFREGVILAPAHGQDHSQDQQQENSWGRQGVNDHADEDSETGADTDGSVADSANRGSDGSIVNNSSGHPSGETREGSFEGEAEKLEQKYRFLHRN